MPSASLQSISFQASDSAYELEASPQPLNYWSNITLVAWDVPERKGYEIYQALSNLSKEPKLRLLEPDDYMTVEEKQAIAHELIEI